MIQRDVPLRVEGRELRFDLYDGCQSTSRGALVFLHGGGFIGGCKEQFTAAAACIALQTDYVCLSLDYSLAPTYSYPTQVQDVWAICRWIKARAQHLGVDERRIVLAGGSPGGCIAAMSVLSDPEEVKREMILPLQHAILLNPILDLEQFAETNPQEREAMSAFMPQKELWRKLSPVALAQKNAEGKSFLILHGQNDQIVPLSQAYAFAEMINTYGGTAKVKVYSNERHAWFNEPLKQPDVISDMIQYLNGLSMIE